MVYFLFEVHNGCCPLRNQKKKEKEMTDDKYGQRGKGDGGGVGSRTGSEKA